MSDEHAEREALAQSILDDARARASAIDHNGVRVNMLRAAERKAERVRAGQSAVASACSAAPAGRRAPLVSRDLRDLDGVPRATQRRPCLRCRIDFDSVGPGNRMCEPCRTRSADASPYAV